MSNTKFMDHVTKVAFHLTLSRGMIFALSHIAKEEHEFGTRPSSWPQREDWYAAGFKADSLVPRARELGARGLIEHTDPARMKPPYSKPAYKLTEAGWHVFQLLVIAGLAKPLTTEKQRRKAA